MQSRRFATCLFGASLLGVAAADGQEIKPDVPEFYKPREMMIRLQNNQASLRCEKEVGRDGDGYEVYTGYSTCLWMTLHQTAIPFSSDKWQRFDAILNLDDRPALGSEVNTKMGEWLK